MESTVNRNYKDSLFRMLFSEKKELLSLYNAVRDAHYTNEEDLEINTLQGIIYLGMRNDISFVIDGELSLYEHQSTCCGNNPLRNLLYISDLYAGSTSKDNIFGSKCLGLSRPRFIVFYNGVKDMPDWSVQKLSDAYEHIVPKPENSALENIENVVDLELVVTVLNINKGHNEDLMCKCKSLREYSIYVDKVRCYSKKMPMSEAVEKAIDECINDNVLADYLRKHRVEVKHMSIYEFNQELYDEGLREEGREEGKEEGRKEGRKEGRNIEQVILIIKKVQKNKSLETIANELECIPEEISRLYEAVKKCDPDYNINDIIALLETKIS